MSALVSARACIIPTTNQIISSVKPRTRQALGGSSFTHTTLPFKHHASTSMPPKRKAATKASADATADTKKSKSALAVGDNVSSVDTVLLTNDGKEVTLAEITKDTGVVIFMYPKANTSGCTKQACGFRDNYAEIEAAGFGVYGMSFDSPTSQTNWAIKYNLPYALLTDSNGDALKAFGAFKAPKNVIRSHVVIEKGGKLVDIRNQIPSGDSFGVALDTVQELAKK